MSVPDVSVVVPVPVVSVAMVSVEVRPVSVVV